MKTKTITENKKRGFSLEELTRMELKGSEAPLDNILDKKGSECIKVLNEIEYLLSSATVVPLTGKIMVDAKSLFDLTEEFRKSFPEELEHSENLIKNIQDLVISAENRGANIVANAEEKANAILNESRILTEAQEKATLIINKAMEDREHMKREAYEYVMSMFSSVENSMLNSVASVQETMNSFREGV